MAFMTVDPHTYMQLHMRGKRRGTIRRQVSDLKIGDVFDWAGRAVTLEDYKPARTYAFGGPSRYLIVSEGEELHQLHYYDREVVILWSSGETP